ncbi:MAG: hypothetical protein EBS01_07530 [Verrucomicrobia bacterium]|nr:hypothetical protein [Verrucomicrobiota bacterium]
MRRKFFEASQLDGRDKRSVAVVVAIGRLYEVEQRAREAKLTELEREALRQRECPALLASVKALETTVWSMEPMNTGSKTPATIHIVSRWVSCLGVSRSPGPGVSICPAFPQTPRQMTLSRAWRPSTCTTLSARSMALGMSAGSSTVSP